MKFEKSNTFIKEKNRQTEYNEELNLIKRRRTFSGIEHLDFWNKIKEHINFENKIECLEIGSHEGQSAMFFLKHFLLNKESSLLCCDIWIKSHWLYNNPLGLCYEDIFDYNIRENDKNKQIKKYMGANNKLYKEEWFVDKEYDIIYIDDIHTKESTILNVKNCLPKLKKGGIIIFDDYDKHKGSYPIEHASKYCDPVKEVVDDYIKNNNDIEIIHKEYQIFLKKI